MRREMEAYREHLLALGRRPKTLDGYSQRLRQFRAFLRTRGIETVQEVTTESARAYHEDLLRRHLKSSSRRSLMTTVRLFLGWLYERGRILSDVARRLELPATEERLPPAPLGRDDVWRLIALASNPRDAAVLEVLYATGVRASELVALDVDDVDFAVGTVFVRRGKGGKQRVVPIHARALGAVRRYLAGRGEKVKKDGPLFVVERIAGRTKRFDMNNLGGLFHRLNERFPKHVHAHLLRHTFALHLLQNGCPIRVLQEYLGHSSPDTTALYLNLLKEDLKKAYDAGMERVLSRWPGEKDEKNAIA